MLEARTAQLEHGLSQAASAANIPVTINRIGSMITVFFSDQPVTDFASASATNSEHFKRWFHGLLSRGVYWPASSYEAAFFSYAHSEQDIDAVIEAAAEAFNDLTDTV